MRQPTQKLQPITIRMTNYEPTVSTRMLSPIFNSDFRGWQEKHNAGGDFIVFSDVLWLDPLPHQKVIYL